MDVTDLVRRLARRRWAVVVVLVVAVVAGVVSWSHSTATEQSSAAVVIVPPRLGTAVSDQNPLLNLDNNLAQLATVLAAALDSTTVTTALDSQGATDAYTISTVTGTDPSFAQLSPQLVFTVTGSDASSTQRTATSLVKQARDQLRLLQTQANVPSDARASLVQVVAPTGGTSVGGSKLRSSGSIFLAILVLGLLAVLVFDEVRRRRFTAPTLREATTRGAHRPGRRRMRSQDAAPRVPRSR